jgi:tetratricopeptide (TPR) repeat protein
LAGLLAMVVATPAALGAAGVTQPVVLGGATVLAAAVGGFAAVVQERFQRASQRAEDQTTRVVEGCLTLGEGRLPRVRDVPDPIVFGTHPSRSPDGSRGRAGKVSSYVARDADALLHAELARSGFVLLVGDSTAGKTRTAYEAMAAVLPDHVLILPDDRAALPAALAAAADTSRCVLWLDNLERFLGVGGLSGVHVTRLLSGSRHRVIIATMRGSEERRFTEVPHQEHDPAMRDAVNAARQVLAQVTYRVRLDRMFTSAERDRAGVVAASDASVAEGLRYADEYGLGEYLACGPELRQAFENAWEPGANPRGAALIAAAIDVKRMGVVNPVPKALLTRLHERYLAARGGNRLRPESPDEAWEWVTRRRRATAALLQPTADDSAVVVFDYLVDEAQRRSPEPPPDDVVLEVLRAADADDADIIGSFLLLAGGYKLAKHAFERAYEQRCAVDGAEHPDALLSRAGIAHALWELGDFAGSQAEHRAVLAVQRRVLGEEHPQTLTGRRTHALSVWDLGRLAEAEAELRDVLAVQRRVLGEEHPETVLTRGARAWLLQELGAYAEAEAEHRKVVDTQLRTLGDSHADTLISRHGLAMALWRSGRWEDAEAEQRQVLRLRRQVLGPEHPDTLISRNNLALVLRDRGLLQEALAEHRAVLAVRQRTFGSEHPATLLSRDNIAVVLRDLGTLQEALAEHSAVLGVRRRTLGEEHPDTLVSRDNRAFVLRELGEVAEAEAEHGAVLALRRRTLGEEHPDTLVSRDNRALALRELGETAEAEAEHRSVLDVRMRVLGADHPHVAVSRARVAEVADRRGQR